MFSRERGFTPAESAHVEAVLSPILKVEGKQAVYCVLQAVTELSTQLRKNPIQQVETYLRQIGSDIYFLAIPVSFMKNNLSMLPNSGRKKYPYFLDVFNGEERAMRGLEEIKATTEENFAHLAKTGLLVPKRGTAYFRKSRARDN